MDHRRVIRRYFGFQFFFPLFLWLPVFYEYQKRIGLDDAQIFSIQSIYYWVFCLLELPTGIMADRWGYRFGMRSGALVIVAAGLFPIFAPGFAGFLTHFLLIALGRSLVSGAASAYLYDFLKSREGSSDGLGIRDYKRVEGNARAYSLIGKILLWPAVGGLMEWHLPLPYWITLVASLVSVGYAFSLPRLDGVQKEEARQGGFVNFREIATLLVARPLLPLIMVQGVALFTLSRILQINLFQPILNDKGFSLTTHGMVMSFMTVFETWGSFSPTLPFLGSKEGGKGRFADLNAVFIFTLVMATSLILMEFSGISGTWVGLGVFSYVIGAAFPVQKQLMNDAIPDSRYRATLLSVESIVDRAACAAAASFVAAFVQRGEVGLFLRLSGWSSIAMMVVLYLGIRIATSARRVKVLPES